MKQLAACLTLVVALLPSAGVAAGGTDLRKLFHKPHLALPQGFPDGFDVVPCTYALNWLAARPLAWEGLCRQAQAASGAAFGGDRSSAEAPDLVVSAVQCDLRDMVTMQAWTLDLRTDIHPHLLSTDIESVGSLVSGETRFAVVESHAIDGLNLPSEPPIGFLFSRDGRWVAAADAGPAGGLRLEPTADRGPIVAGSTALLLHAALANPVLSGGH